MVANLISFQRIHNSSNARICPEEKVKTKIFKVVCRDLATWLLLRLMKIQR